MLEETQKEKSLELKSIQDIMDAECRFYIPAYQRGYRWTSETVETFIKDLEQFMKEEGEKEKSQACPFYSMQTIVFKPTDNIENGLEVIDGQQRLTTILIILNVLYTLDQRKLWSKIELVPDLLRLDAKCFSIKYATRTESQVWLQELTKNYVEDCLNGNTAKKDKWQNLNPDYYHFADVFYKTAELINNMSPTTKINFIIYLREKTKFIWYDMGFANVNDSAEDVFDRLNATKISLNNAELIKAIFLQKDNFNNNNEYRLNQIAVEWDSIERRLQEPNFWGFIYSSNHPFKYETHIEYLFDMIAKKSGDDKDKDYFTFNKFYEDFLQADIRYEYVENKWKEIQKIYYQLEEWYNDRLFYHYIGYLIEYKENICGLINNLQTKDKDEIKDILIEKIKNTLSDITVEKLFYKNGDILTKVLLLFNIQSEQNRKNEAARFSFAEYKQIRDGYKWNLEHVASHVDSSLDINKRKTLASDLLEYFTGIKDDSYSNEIAESVENLTDVKELCQSLKIFFNETPKNDEDKADFDKKITKVFEDIMKHFEAKEENNKFLEEKIGKKETNIEEKNFIWNFVLLNSKTNMSYGNSIFPIKRKRILWDEDAVYTPLGTRAIFQKAYSTKLTDMMVWGRHDALNYWKKICDTLAIFDPKTQVFSRGELPYQNDSNIKLFKF